MPKLEKPPAPTDGSKQASSAREDSRVQYLPPRESASWERAYEARVSLIAQELAELERKAEFLRRSLALANDELEMRRRLCRCRRTS